MGIELQNKLSDGEVTANRDEINLLSQREELLDGLLLIYFNVIEQQKADIKDDELSKRQNLTMKNEIKALKGIFDCGYRSQNQSPGNDEISTFFNDIFNKIKEQCPFTHQILSSLAVDECAVSSNSTKTEEFKMKQAMHSLALLMNIHNQKWANDFPLMFGLAAVSYGGGEKFVTFLNSIGMSTSWKTL